MEGHIADAAGFGPTEVVETGIAAIGGSLTGRTAIEGDMRVEHGQEAFTVRRIAVLDDQIKDQAAPAGCEVELVTILDAPPAFDDNIGMRLEQADDLLAAACSCSAVRPWAD